MTFGDIDNDGDLDIAGYANIDEPYQIKVYRNDNPARHWLRVRPIGHAGRRRGRCASSSDPPVGHKAPWHPATGRRVRRTHCFQAAASTRAWAPPERHFGFADDHRKNQRFSTSALPSVRRAAQRGAMHLPPSIKSSRSRRGRSNR
jgi:hypothetical protein